MYREMQALMYKVKACVTPWFAEVCVSNKAWLTCGKEACCCACWHHEPQLLTCLESSLAVCFLLCTLYSWLFCRCCLFSILSFDCQHCKLSKLQLTTSMMSVPFSVIPVLCILRELVLVSHSLAVQPKGALFSSPVSVSCCCCCCCCYSC